MRKIIVQEMLSADGFFCGPKGEIDWHLVDAEFNDAAVGFLDTLDTLIFGRVTYDLMAGYWPTEGALKDDPRVAERMNALQKIVFSTTIDRSPWNNTVMKNTIDAKEIAGLKHAEGKDIAIFGSGMVVAQLARLGLIDGYRFIVNPVVLGVGRTLFATAPQRYALSLQDVKRFASGNVLLAYAPA